MRLTTLTYSNSLCFYELKISHEKQKSDGLREEINQLKLNGQNIKEQKEKLQNDLLTQRNVERKLDHLLTEARKQITELQDKFNFADKQIVSNFSLNLVKKLKLISIFQNELSAALEAEKNISSKKRNALQIATDEITKANAIISKQNREIVELKKKNSWRADIAVKQEQAIQKIEKEKSALLAELSKVDTETKDIDKLRKDFDDQVTRLKKSNEDVENKYTKSKLLASVNMKIKYYIYFPFSFFFCRSKRA